MLSIKKSEEKNEKKYNDKKKKTQSILNPKSFKCKS